MKKQDYINDPIVNQFIQYFTALATDPRAEFIQNYKPRTNKQRFSIQHFSAALEQYHWNKSDYYATTIELELHANRIQKALQQQDQHQALLAAIRIFEWGGVINRASVSWLADQADQDNLVGAINESITILTSDHDEQLHRFAGNNVLRSDSATTKLFSLASKEQSIIYDNRVGAALGAIAKAFLIDAGIHEVPEALNFMRGDATKRDQKRNPSDDTYQFQIKETGEKHALWNLRTNWIISQVVKNWQCPLDVSVNSPLREIEAILFMIGYDITTIETISVPQ